MSPGKRKVPSIHTDPQSSWKRRALKKLPKSEICKLQTCYYNHPWSQLEGGCPLPISPLSAGWLQGWAMSTHPRHPGGLAHPHWQCVDWQLGTDELEFPGELDSSHPGALRLVAHPPPCAHSVWPLTLFPIVSSLFPSFPPFPGPRFWNLFLFLLLQPWKQWLQRWN